MTGARKLAADFVLPHIKSGVRLLDVGAGDCWLSLEASRVGAKVFSIDKQISWASDVTPCFGTLHDLRNTPWPLEPESFNLIVAVYSLQHLLSSEARAWAECRRLLKPEGKLLVVGRYRHDAAREVDRADPLNGHSEQGIASLCLATGFEVVEFRQWRYREDIYAEAYGGNAFTLEARPI